jgi:hypothetical protein
VVTLTDFLTPDEIRAALLIWVTDQCNFRSRVLAEVIVPALPEINRKLGQENVAAFIAYVVEHVFKESQK